jgi:ATP-dependent Clp protease ATP-binding subunit ClpX
VEDLMTDIMYDLPDLEMKGKFVITEAIVRGEKTLFERKKSA